RASTKTHRTARKRNLSCPRSLLSGEKSPCCLQRPWATAAKGSSTTKVEPDIVTARQTCQLSQLLPPRCALTLPANVARVAHRARCTVRVGVGVRVPTQPGTRQTRGLSFEASATSG